MTTKTLWMGGLDDYMSESFIEKVFADNGHPCSSNIKIVREKSAGKTLIYAFVQFPDTLSARKALAALNNKDIPGCIPPKKYKLNIALKDVNNEGVTDNSEHSLYVRDLSDDVDDYLLYKAFHDRYPSVRTAKVVMDSNGYTRGYGFVRFASSAEHSRALSEMNGFSGLGKRAIKVNMAVQKSGAPTPKYPSLPPQPSSATLKAQNIQSTYETYYNYYNNYYNYYNQTNQNDYYDYYQNYYNYYNPLQPQSNHHPQLPQYHHHQLQHPHTTFANEKKPIEEPKDDLAPIETVIDIGKANQEFMKNSEELYLTLSESRWNSEIGIVPLSIPAQS